jgi:L-serine dehydratase
MISVFDMFSIGIGPSSSHTVGPMRAANQFIDALQEAALLTCTHHIKTELFGSLGQTGKGHGSGKAVMLGLMGYLPETLDTDKVDALLASVEHSEQLKSVNDHLLAFPKKDAIVFHRKKSLPLHANGMRFQAINADGELISSQDYYSIGGGFIVKAEEFQQAKSTAQLSEQSAPFPYNSSQQLVSLCKEHGISISTLMLKNELVLRDEVTIKERLLEIWQVMQDCIERGIKTEGVLPGGLKLHRRANKLHRRLINEKTTDPLSAMDWVNLFALAVNEENAAGGKVVTAPTNGAAGIIPAVLKYFDKFVRPVDDDTVVRYLLTAAAIGILYKQNASISGAEVGCQGEVGVACSMAAGALAEIMGGTFENVENAAEIGMEHNLGLTCDPVGGLVQVPCIERNAMGAIKAINAARLALRGTGDHKVSLDKVIKTMRDTGMDMKSKYKETARGGLAVNIIEC